ncbi:EF-hand domain-containing protein [Actinomadura rayongensis]|uniref:Calcium sensor EFh n=1 Tax=Actinomadura rayongensis TaxID=1429076 RepID=A0A6I4W5R5_9ACTN|nr:EF-hand domain-containing protein [Actinomadura rayongensis]MXQ64848.1 calcium sensor EFh [Actinomadura rayongensis]
MATSFQRDKVRLVFDAMDGDGDGALHETDFEALARRWAATRVAGDEDRLLEVMRGWWNTLAEHARNADAVSVDDVLTVVDLLTTMPDAVTATADAMFEAVDENGDGLISPAEYRRMIEAWSGESTDTGTTFDLLDSNGDGAISRAEFAAHWYEFWAGNDPKAPGSRIFGNVPS